MISPGIVSGMTKVHIEGINPNSNTGTNSIPKYFLLVIGAVKQNNQTTTSNFPCNFNFAVSNMNRFNQGIDHG